MSKNDPAKDDDDSGIFAESLAIVARTVTNPLFLFGIFFGGVVGMGLCWVIFVLPIHRNLSEREAQLQKWSQLNQQLQTLAMENRQISQEELKKMVAANQEAGTSFQEVQRLLHQRELRMMDTPTSYILIPVFLLVVTCCGIVFLFKALNQRALATVDHVLQLAPREIVEEIVRRHKLLESARASLRLSSVEQSSDDSHT